MFGALTVALLAILFFKSPIAQAVADNMRRQGGRRGAGDPALAQKMEMVLQELHDVRADVTELAERLDFTERMLADVRRRNALPG